MRVMDFCSKAAAIKLPPLMDTVDASFQKTADQRKALKELNVVLPADKGNATS